MFEGMKAKVGLSAKLEQIAAASRSFTQQLKGKEPGFVADHRFVIGLGIAGAGLAAAAGAYVYVAPASIAAKVGVVAGTYLVTDVALSTVIAYAVAKGVQAGAKQGEPRTVEGEVLPQGA